ncbi:MAG TPA: DUF427 domain-containing protein [Kribbellaceae bacterium]
MRDYPAMPTRVNHVEPVPRRIRGFVRGETVFDTTRALYVWENPNYPQYYIPLDDIRPGVLVDEDEMKQNRRGTFQVHGLRVGDDYRPAVASVLKDSAVEGIAGTVRFDWDGLDSWFEEDEPVIVHPRNPYTRVDCVRSNRPVRIELDGVVLADSHSHVALFETGLPTRYYLDRTDVDLTKLVPSDTVTSCPYKGTTTGYWSTETRRDIAWTYDFPLREVQPIAGLIAFYNEKVDIYLDGELLERPRTKFS